MTVEVIYCAAVAKIYLSYNLASKVFVVAVNACIEYCNQNIVTTLSDKPGLSQVDSDKSPLLVEARVAGQSYLSGCSIVNRFISLSHANRGNDVVDYTLENQQRGENNCYT
jgi:hypothetical protein